MMLSALSGLLAHIGLADMIKPPPPKPNEVFRTPWTLHEDGFLRRWLVCGAFPAGKQGFATDYLLEHGGEAAIVPAAGLTQQRPDGSIATWHEFASDHDIVDLHQACADRPAALGVGYAFTSIYRASAGNVLFRVGSDAGIKLWVNGSLVGTHDLTRKLGPDQDQFIVALRAGYNNVLLKVNQHEGKWRFIFRVAEIPRPLYSTPGHANLSYVLAPSISRPRNPSPNMLVLHTDVKNDPQQLVRVSVVTAGGATLATATAMRGNAVAFSVATWPEGVYEIRCQAEDAGGLPLTGHLLVYKGNPWPAVSRLVQVCGKADNATELGMHETALAGLLQHALGDPWEITSHNRSAVYSTLLEFAELQQQQAGQDGPIHPYGFVRLPYRDEIDNTPQFCRVFLPPGYDPAQRWPLVVSLHGKDEENPSYDSYPGMERHFDSEVDRYRVIMLYPHGRGNTFYQGIGDRDVLRCLALAKAHFSINDDRVYLTGGSMGGAGTWYVGTHYPELFAALAPYFGGREYRVTYDPAVLAALSPRQLFRLERLKSAFTNAESLLTTPVFVNHGSVDKTVPVGISRYGVSLLQSWGYDVGYWEHPGLGHHSPTGGEDATMEWLLSHTRVTHPRLLRLRACQLRYAAAHWLRVEAEEDAGAYMLAEAEVFAPNSIRLDTQNILQVTLSPGTALIDSTKPVRVIWNDVESIVTMPDGNATLRAPNYTPTPREKTPALGGPTSDIYLTPFAIVQGTIARDPAMRAQCQQVAVALANQWEEDQHWKPRIFLDTEMTPADTAGYSLFLVGGNEENLVTHQLAAQLPLAVTPSTVTIAGRTFAGLHDVAVQMLYPHPLNPERYVAVLTSTSADGMKNAGKLEIDTDFCLADGAASPWLAAGYFDHAWQIDERFIEWGKTKD